MRQPDADRTAGRAAWGSGFHQQIADELVRERETVKTHVARVLRKLSLANRTQLATQWHNRTSHPSCGADSLAAGVTGPNIANLSA